VATYLRAPEAARRLGVTLPTLYAYVSRGRVTRVRAADGRTSLFELDQIEALRTSTGRAVPPPPSIDVQISTSITQLDEDGVRFRGRPIESLVGEGFERVAEYLWSGELPGPRPDWTAPDHLPTITADIGGLLTLTAQLAATTPTSGPADPGIDATRSLLAAIPRAAGVDDDGIYAGRIARMWHEQPDPTLVRAIDAALVLLADHELALSALAVRVATSTRSSPLACILAGLATAEGGLHGGASHHVHDLLQEIERRGDTHAVLADRLDRSERIPGFGHAVYRQRDPRVDPLLHAVRQLPDHDGRIPVIEALLDVAGARLTHHPNVDLGLGALTYVAQLPHDAPLFPIARIAGLTAHRIEELDERPLRFRGLSRRPV